MSSVIVFGPTGQVGSVAARTAAEYGAKVWLAMRDTTKSIPGLPGHVEKAGGRFQRVQADLQDPESVGRAVEASGARRAFVYRVAGGGLAGHLKDAIAAMKAAGVDFVVFLSSFTVLVNLGLREIPQADLLPFVHTQVEANLEDAFGPDGCVALRPGSFATNMLRDKDAIAAGGEVRLYGVDFEQDNVAPDDVGRVAGSILALGPRNGQKKVYVYGPQRLSVRDSVAEVGRVLGKDLTITAMGPEEGYNNYIRLGMPPVAAEYMVQTLSGKGPDKGGGERFPKYEEGVSNVELYTGRPATSLEDWVKENRAVFGV